MSKFAIQNPYFILVVCLMIAVVGVTSLVQMPVDIFQAMNIPLVPPARAVPGGRSVSLMMTVIMGPAAYCVATATMILLRPTT
jgi:multidrug efflux pump subunit AcrB